MTARWSRDAQDDLVEAETYLLARDRAAAERLVRTAIAAAGFLAEHPRVGPIVPGRRMRKWRIRGTRYLMLYRVIGADIRIVRLMHDARNWIRFI